MTGVRKWWLAVAGSGQAACVPFVALAAFLSFAPVFSKRAAAAEPAVNGTGPGFVEIGGVRVERATERLSFLATVNMDEGEIEYALVQRAGKVHESLLVTEIQPQDVQVGALLLGWRTATNSATSLNRDLKPATSVGGNTNAGGIENAPGPPEGERIRIRVEFILGTNMLTMPLEELVRHAGTGAPLTPGPWVYNGSEIFDGKFAAQREGSFIAVMDDPLALVNNPRPGRENDKLWRVNERRVPPRGTKARVVLEPWKRNEP